MDEEGEDDDSVTPLAVGDEEDEELDAGTVAEADDVNKEKSADDGNNVNGRRTSDEDNSGTLYNTQTHVHTNQRGRVVKNEHSSFFHFINCIQQGGGLTS